MRPDPNALFPTPRNPTGENVASITQYTIGKDAEYASAFYVLPKIGTIGEEIRVRQEPQHTELLALGGETIPRFSLFYTRDNPVLLVHTGNNKDGFLTWVG